jgi:hypothetical protein
MQKSTGFHGAAILNRDKQPAGGIARNRGLTTQKGLAQNSAASCKGTYCTQQRCNLPTALHRVRRLATELERVPITFRCSCQRPTASCSDRSSSQATGTGCRGASAPGIVAWCKGKCTGLFLRSDATTPRLSTLPTTPDRPHGHGLLYADLLLVLTAMPIESVRKHRVCARKFRLVQVSRVPSHVRSQSTPRR